MADIAALQIKVDATSAEKATKSLDVLNKSSENLEKTTDKLKKTNVNAWASMNAISAAEDAASDKAWALANGYKEVNGQLIKMTDVTGKSSASLKSLGLNTKESREQIMMLGKEAVTGDFSRMPRTFGSLVTNSNLLASAMSPIGIAVIGVTTAVIAGAFAWKQWGGDVEEANKKAAKGIQGTIKEAERLRLSVRTPEEEMADIKRIIQANEAQIELNKTLAARPESKKTARVGVFDIMSGSRPTESISSSMIKENKALEQSNESLFRQIEKIQEKINKPDTKSIREANAIQKSKLAFDLGNIKNAADEEINISKNKEKLLDEDRNNRLITEADYYEKKKEFIIKNSQATSKELSDLLESYEKEKFAGKEKYENDTKIAKVQSDIRKAYENTTTALDAIDNKQSEMRKKTDWTHGITTSLRKFKEEAADVAVNVERMMLTMSNGMVDGVASSVSKSIVYGKNLEESLTSAAQNVADAFITSLIKIGIQQLFVNETLKAGYVLQVASQSQSTAWMAAENAFAATSIIPFVGPALAPAAAAESYATATAFGAAAIAAASARDGYDIPAGVNPVTQLHEKEMVLPAAQADVIRGMARNGGGGGQIIDNTVINIDSRSDRMQVMKDVQRMIENGHSRLVDKLQRQRALA